MHPDDSATASDFDSLSEAERFALEVRWYEGRMLPYVEWLMSMVERRREEILLSANGSLAPADLLAATKRMVVVRGSVHMAAELKDQMREIQNELWYRGERGEHDRADIQREWTARHAAAWRRWRIREYLFVADRCARQIVAALLSSAGEAREASS